MCSSCSQTIETLLTIVVNKTTVEYRYPLPIVPSDLYGLVKAPSLFQVFINGVLGDMLGRVVTPCIDNILIYSKSLEKHIQNVKKKSWTDSWPTLL